MPTVASPTLIPSALTSLEAVKNWVFGANPPAGQPAAADALIIDLINKASRLVLAVLSRPNLLAHTVTEVRGGSGGHTMMLAEWPVLGDLSLTIDGKAQTARIGTAPGTGWVLTNPWDGLGPGAQAVLALDGATFPRGYGNVSLSYTAGYAITAEAQTIASDGTVWPAGPAGPWAANRGATYANGTAFVAVAASPTAGQYIPPANPQSPYQFNVAEANTVVLLSYSFAPYELAYATTKWVGEWYKYKSRIGEMSKSLGGNETAAFKIEAMPDDVKLTLQQFSRVVPLRT